MIFTSDSCTGVVILPVVDLSQNIYTVCLEKGID